jgi:hypothetical protein
MGYQKIRFGFGSANSFNLGAGAVLIQSWQWFQRK